MKLTHHTDEPFRLNRKRTYEQTSRQHKPHGLWLAVDDDWRRWCESEEFALERLVVNYGMTIVPDANVLHLKTPEDLYDFTEIYGLGHWHVNWPLIAMQYAGIVIAPYQWSCRLNTRTDWYYPWDCASACIWDLSVIKSKTRLPDTPVPADYKKGSVLTFDSEAFTKLVREGMQLLNP